MDEDDRRDIEAILAGDGETYRRFIQRHQQFVASRMRRFTRDRTALEELVHDVFVEAYFSLKNFRGDAPIQHWLAKIATRVGYRFWKRKSRDSRMTPLDEKTTNVETVDV